MKKLLILIITINTTIFAQCHKSESPSSATATFTGGFTNTMNVELSVRIKTVYIGGGAGVMIDNKIQTQNNIEYTRNDHVYFLRVLDTKKIIYSLEPE